MIKLAAHFYFAYNHYKKSSKPKVIILTGVVNYKTIWEINEYPYDKLLYKPVEVKELYNLIVD